MKLTRTARLRRHVSPSNLIAAGAVLLAGCGVLSACGGGNDGNSVPGNTKPAFAGEVTINRYNGVSDDLLTAGLGVSGLALATVPTIANPTAPVAAESCRLAIYANYRASADMAAKGNYGTLYGLNVDASGNVAQGFGMIPGTEYVTHSDDGTEQQNTILLVQIPDGFDVNNPCTITATSSGSHGIHGAIPTGEWGLKRECAVVYIDKGTGAGPHDLATDTVVLQDGTRITCSAAGSNAHFVAPLTNSQLAAFNTIMPNRLAFKHAHSQRNPEKNWSLFTLQAVQLASWTINDKVAGASGALVGSVLPAHPDNIIVIASSISNSGGAAIVAVERDTGRWVDGVAVGEPGLDLSPNTGMQVVRGGTTLLTTDKSLFDYVSYTNVSRLCAISSASIATAPTQAFFGSPTMLPIGAQADRCAAFKAAGSLTSTMVAAQTDEVLQKMYTYGWESESDLVHASTSFYEINPSVSTMLSNALSRVSMIDNLYGLSFAATDIPFHPTAVNTTALAQMAVVGNGIPPTSGVQLVNDNTQGSPMRSNQPVDSIGTQAVNLDGALCLHNLLTGVDAASQSSQADIRQTLRTGNLQGRPALIVQGRNDALLPVNHGSRPCLGLNAKVEGGSSRLSYIEVINVQHFDDFIDLVPGYDTLSAPLVLYEQRALDAMCASLKNGTPLPPSQVVRTTPRGGTPGAAPVINAADLPNFISTPVASDHILVGVSGGVAMASVPS